MSSPTPPSWTSAICRAWAAQHGLRRRRLGRRHSDPTFGDNGRDHGRNNAIFGVNAFAAIQEGIDAVDDTGTVEVYAGSYAETLLVEKSLSLLGPNAGLDGTDAGRAAEAVIYP